MKFSSRLIYNPVGITLADIDPVWGLVILTAVLAVITAYYAKQTRDLSRNQFRPYCYALLQPNTSLGLSLYLRNNGPGIACNVKVEYSIRGVDGSKENKSFGAKMLEEATHIPNVTISSKVSIENRV